MSLEVIEIMIKEALRDGVISENEKLTIIQEAEAFGISRNLVESILDEQKSLTEKRINDELEEDKLEKERKENLKYEHWNIAFKKRVIEIIRRSDKRVLSKEATVEFREIAVRMKIDFNWLDNWIKEHEESEQAIAGIKKGFFSKFFGK